MLQSRIRRGELDREVTFLKKIVGENETGEDEDLGWEVVGVNPYAFAKVIQRPGKEMMIANRVTFVQTTLFIIDHRTDLTTGNRIYYNSKVYNILSITEHESGRDMYSEIAAEVLDNEVWT
jgi:SPP1 family predicted phage head-tail adaptor